MTQTHSEPAPYPEPDDPVRLKRALSWPLLTLYGLGVTLGAGIYVLVGATAAQAGLLSAKTPRCDLAAHTHTDIGVCPCRWRHCRLVTTFLD